MRFLVMFILFFPLILPSQNSKVNSLVESKKKEIYNSEYNASEILLSGSKEIIIDVNNLKTPIRNNGIIFETSIWPRPNQFEESDIFFSGGFYLVGKNGNQWWANAVASAARTVDYLPGKVGSNPNDSLNVIYVVKSSDPHFGESWQEWRNAVQLGAEFYDGDGDGNYNPIDKNGNGQWDTNEDKPNILGDYTAYLVYNDSQVDSLRRFRGVPPLGIEIHQTVFGVGNSQTPLDYALFFRYRLFNRGIVNSNLDSVYFMFWADSDLGNYLDDLIGSDTLLNSVYVYNYSSDNLYGENPPAGALTLLQTPVVYIAGETFIDNNSNGVYDEGIDIALDTAKIHYGPILGIKKFPGAKNQKVNTIWLIMKNNPSYINDPNKVSDVMLYAFGKRKDSVYLNPCTWFAGTVLGQPCEQVNPVYVFSGDPVQRIGWIDTVVADYRMLVVTGPFNLNQNQPVDIWCAITVGRGTSNLNSVNVMKQNVGRVFDYYKNNFTLTLIGVDEPVADGFDYELYQNYPNPFNPVTTIKFRIPFKSRVALKIYNLLGEAINTLIEKELDTGEYKYKFDGTKLPSGIYFYELKAGDFHSIKKMILIK